jgi:3-methyladenine DNA glycosylase AlkD
VEMGSKTEYQEVIKRLRSLANPHNVEGMARFGINSNNTLGVSGQNLKSLARETGRDRELAARLWDSGIHEARILACLIDIPGEVTEAQMDAWAQDFDSWDVCDECCLHLFGKTNRAYHKAIEWSKSEAEFIKRAGYVLMAVLAVHDKKAEDRQFEDLFSVITAGSTDNRNFVKKAVNWAIRQIGKRNTNLNQKAIDLTEEMLKSGSDTARWIARDALKELKSPAVQQRLEIRERARGR